jgi:hypothetical protein
MNQAIALGLAMLAGTVIVATALNGLHAQNKAPGAYAVLDLKAINSPDVFKMLPSKTGELGRPYCLIGQKLRSLLAFLSHDNCLNFGRSV